MKATILISAEHFGQVQGDASKTFLIRRAQALRRSSWEAVSVSGVLSPAGAARPWELASRLARAARVRSATAVGAGGLSSGDVQSVERDGGMDEVAGQPLDSGGIPGVDLDLVMHGESRMLPGEEARSGVLVELAASDEHLEDAAAKELLGHLARRRIDGGEVAIAMDEAGGHEGVDVWLPIREVPVGLDRDHHPGHRGVILQSGTIEVAHGGPGAAGEIAEQAAVVQEEDPQPLGDREDPLQVTDRQEHLLGEPLGPQHGALGVARGAKPTHLAREGEQELVPAQGATHPGEAGGLGEAAVEETEQGPLDLAAPESVAGGEAIVVHALEGLEVLLG